MNDVKVIAFDCDGVMLTPSNPTWITTTAS